MTPTERLHAIVEALGRLPGAANFRVRHEFKNPPGTTRVGELENEQQWWFELGKTPANLCVSGFPDVIEVVMNGRVAQKELPALQRVYADVVGGPLAGEIESSEFHHQQGEVDPVGYGVNCKAKL